jgi:hypothetical protein
MTPLIPLIPLIFIAPIGFIGYIGPNGLFLQTVDAEGSGGPIRCTRCRAYINCFAKFGHNGRRWTCCFCGLGNEVPHWYVLCVLDVTRVGA